MIIFKDTPITNVSGHRATETASKLSLLTAAPNSVPSHSRQKRLALKAAAEREKLHDLWMPCLLEYLRQEAGHGRPHTLSSLERDFATLVAKPKRFVEALIRALIIRGILQFFHPAPKDNLPKLPSRYGYLRCEGMTWGGETETNALCAASRNPSNENAVALTTVKTQEA